MPHSDQRRLSDLFQNLEPNDLWRHLLPLRSVLSFMNTGAHPDDETTPLLAVLALRDGVQISHACANRGEGGQNAIGTESGSNLGAVRTREMEQAANVIGLTQYWLSEAPSDPIDDFGFSKSGDETLRNWGENHTLERFVRILRRERPDIVCPTFLDIPGQHGHHQAMTRSAFLAVKMAADPSAFPEQGLQVWQVKKLYLPAWSGAGDAYDDDVPPPKTTVQVDASGADPVRGVDYAQIAQFSRSYHRTQAMGQWVEAGQEMMIPLHLAFAAKGDPKAEESIFDGLPRTLADLAGYAGAPELAADLTEAQLHIDQAFASWSDAKAIGKHALLAIQAVDRADAACPPASAAEVSHRLRAKRRQLVRVLANTAGVSGDLILSTNEVRAGEEIIVSLEITAPELDVQPRLHLPPGWTATEWQNGKCSVTVAKDEPATNPFPDTWFVDRANAPIHVGLHWQFDGTTLCLPVDPQERLNVLPRHSARLSPNRAIVNLQKLSAVNLGIADQEPVTSKPELLETRGWDVHPTSTGVRIQAEPHLPTGLYEFPLMLDGHPAQQVSRMQYDHIGQTNLCSPAILKIRVLDAILPKGRFAYIGGGNDRTDHWLRELGLPIVSLDTQSLKQSRLADFDSILIGIFAFRANPALDARRAELHQWVYDGGNLVTMYHRPWDNWNPASTAPGYLEIGKPSIRWRVTDQNASVTHLIPEHPLLNTPNEIGPDDWQGWHKERGLYFAKDWGAEYQPLLSMSDSDESPLLGALLSGSFGKGRHTHTSLILHHQVEHLVPGAFRLLANLLQPVNAE